VGEDALTVSFGWQDFRVGDGLLIWDGNFDTAGDATTGWHRVPRSTTRPL
jgi:hypothetical protein